MSIISYISKEYKKYKRRRVKKRREAKAQNKALKFSKKVVLFCITFIVLYTVVQTFISYKNMSEITPTLTTCVFAFFGTELCMCLFLKVFDPDKKDNSGDSSASG